MVRLVQQPRVNFISNIDMVAGASLPSDFVTNSEKYIRKEVIEPTVEESWNPKDSDFLKLKATKAVRQATGWGLLECKEFVEFAVKYNLPWITITHKPLPNVKCVQVYPDYGRVVYELHPSKVEDEVRYCGRVRPDVALFVNGECRKTGLLTMSECEKIVKELSANQ